MSKTIVTTIIIAVLTVAAAIAGTIWAVTNYSFRIATVDMDKVFKQSSYGQKINKEILGKRNELLTKFNAAQSTQEKAALQFENDKFSAAKQKEFLDKAKATIAKIAKEKGVKAVTNVSPQFYSEIDLTGSVMKALK